MELSFAKIFLDVLNVSSAPLKLSLDSTIVSLCLCKSCKIAAPKSSVSINLPFDSRMRSPVCSIRARVLHHRIQRRVLFSLFYLVLRRYYCSTSPVPCLHHHRHSKTRITALSIPSAPCVLSPLARSLSTLALSLFNLSKFSSVSRRSRPRFAPLNPFSGRAVPSRQGVLNFCFPLFVPVEAAQEFAQTPRCDPHH